MKNSEELEISILGFIYSQPKHGYELFKEISDLSGTEIVWKVKMGKLYAMLHKLEENGLVGSEITQEGNRPLRNQYNITEKGKKTFDEWIITPVKRGRDFRIAFLLKLFFAIRKGRTNADRLIVDQLNECEGWMKEFKQEEEEIDASGEFNRIVLNFRKSQIKGYMHWLEWCQVNIGKTNQ
jgi:DNA-binding PadR family transcriptional regulator